MGGEGALLGASHCDVVSGVEYRHFAEGRGKTGVGGLSNNCATKLQPGVLTGRKENVREGRIMGGTFALPAPLFPLTPSG